jgi:hypothetical protein
MKWARVLFSLEIADLAFENDAGDGGAVQIRADVPQGAIAAGTSRQTLRTLKGRRSTSPELANLTQIVDAQRTPAWSVVIPFGSLRLFSRF